MPFMLVTLFSFALLVTLAGFFLSYKKRALERKTLFTQPRAERRVTRVREYDEIVPRLPMPRRASLYEGDGRVVVNRAAMTRALPAIDGRLEGGPGGERIPWSVIVITITSIFVLGMFFLNAVKPHNAWFSLLSDTTQVQQTQSSSSTAKAPPLYGASQHLVRISQLDPKQYNSAQDFTLWAYSACSTAAMTEVLNAYGHNFRIADVLKVEASLNEITPELGLVEDIGIAHTMAKFGFKTSWGYSLSYDQVVAMANKGEPVIVGWPPARYDGGHLVVVVGGNSQTVLLADSSLYNRHSLSRAQFMKWWAGFSAVATPQ